MSGKRKSVHGLGSSYRREEECSKVGETRAISPDLFDAVTCMYHMLPFLLYPILIHAFLSGEGDPNRTIWRSQQYLFQQQASYDKRKWRIKKMRKLMSIVRKRSNLILSIYVHVLIIIFLLFFTVMRIMKHAVYSYFLLQLLENLHPPLQIIKRLLLKLSSRHPKHQLRNKTPLTRQRPFLGDSFVNERVIMLKVCAESKRFESSPDYFIR